MKQTFERKIRHEAPKNSFSFWPISTALPALFPSGLVLVSHDVPARLVTAALEDRDRQEATTPTSSRGSGLSGLGIVVQRHAHGASVVAVILPDDALRRQLPKPCVVV